MVQTEKRNPESQNIDTLATEQILMLMNREDAKVITAVKAAIHSLTKAVEDAVRVIRKGGKIFYTGAGTSGRLGVLDASEMPSTFSVSPKLFQAIIAGGDRAIRKSVEGAEDDVHDGRRAAAAVAAQDMVIGISASGKTPFVLAFLKESKKRGARCWLITCNDINAAARSQEPEAGTKKRRPLRSFLDGIIKLLAGPEIIAGSTRMKAGTATKLALNMLSTATMIKAGRVYRGYMVDVVPSSRKLIRRAESIIMDLTGCTQKEASLYLRRSGMKTKVAIVMKMKNVSKTDAERLLRKAEGRLSEIIP